MLMNALSRVFPGISISWRAISNQEDPRPIICYTLFAIDVFTIFNLIQRMIERFAKRCRTSRLQDWCLKVDCTDERLRELNRPKRNDTHLNAQACQRICLK